jgi:catechol 2,3-dioxygenase-like lactoylglutathione lyase family enzyme
MLKITAIDHVVLRTDKLSAMLTFYCDVLGCQIEREKPDLGLTQLRAGNALIDLVTVDGELGSVGGGPPAAKDNNMDHFCLQLEPISEQALSQHLQQHGIDTPDFSLRYGAQGYGQSVYIEDPQGNIVELRSQFTQSNNRDGQN